jgi:hypothetical protein
VVSAVAEQSQVGEQRGKHDDEIDGPAAAPAPQRRVTRRDQQPQTGGRERAQEDHAQERSARRGLGHQAQRPDAGAPEHQGDEQRQQDPVQLGPSLAQAQVERQRHRGAGGGSGQHEDGIHPLPHSTARGVRPQLGGATRHCDR